MNLYLAIPVLLMASLIAASGIAAITRGWVLPWNRRTVRRPRLHGIGQSVIAVSLCWHLAFGLLRDGSNASEWGVLTGSALLVAGALVMLASTRGEAPAR
ncbi:hypothetical protein GL263_27470 [Streptomyces durbertensis]|uniref:Integral membrane protein n=1 Tax=Streptomyces durbertensis TaxID=2448886 RepID=A0ABR6EPK2_9ACTN|nr:hypothetical protein [Streptomyces durbertensis]